MAIFWKIITNIPLNIQAKHVQKVSKYQKFLFRFFWILIRILYVRLSLELFFSNKLPTTCFLQKCTIAGSLKISTWFFLFNECKDALWMCISTDFDVNDNLSFSCDIHDKRWNNNIVLQLVAFVKSLHMTRLH